MNKSVFNLPNFINDLYMTKRKSSEFLLEEALENGLYTLIPVLDLAVNPDLAIYFIYPKFACKGRYEQDALYFKIRGRMRCASTNIC